MSTRNFPQQGVVITPESDESSVSFNSDKSTTYGRLIIVDLPPTHGRSLLSQTVIPEGALQFEGTEDYIFFENDLTEEYITFEK